MIESVFRFDKGYITMNELSTVYGPEENKIKLVHHGSPTLYDFQSAFKLLRDTSG